MDNRKNGLQFPSNSYSAKQKVAPKKVERVTKGTARPRKKTFGERFKEVFFAMDFLEAMKRVVTEILIPDTQGTMSEMLKGTIDMMFYGDRRGRGGRLGRGVPNIYTGSASRQPFYDPQGHPYNDPRQPVNMVQASNIVAEDLSFPTREDAEAVLGEMLALIREYGAVSVREMYQLAGITADGAKDRYGWRNLDDACCSRVADGWLLDLPRPMVID